MRDHPASLRFISCRKAASLAAVAALLFAATGSASAESPAVQGALPSSVRFDVYQMDNRLPGGQMFTLAIWLDGPYAKWTHDTGEIWFVQCEDDPNQNDFVDLSMDAIVGGGYITQLTKRECQSWSTVTHRFELYVEGQLVVDDWCDLADGTVIIVPEPATLALLVPGILILWRRRRSAAARDPKG
jgi:hypothetical protein